LVAITAKEFVGVLNLDLHRISPMPENSPGLRAPGSFLGSDIKANRFAF